ncbi:MAG: PKD domain-containing protein [Thermoleophilaceae bacterium]
MIRGLGGLLPAGLALAALMLPAGAGAQSITTPSPVLIDGSPLNIFLGDSGSQQARFDGTTSGEFFSPGNDEPNAGFQLVVDVDETNADHISANTFMPVSQAPVTGSGTQADPFSQVTHFSTDANPEQTPDTILITQTTTYVEGTSFYNLRWDVTNQGDEGTIIRPQLYADLVVGGNDRGVGFFEPGPPAVVGGVNQETGASGGIVQITPWAKFEEDRFSTVFSHTQDFTGPGLDNSISPELEDNGVAVQFQDTNLGPNQTATFEAAWRFAQTAAAPPPQETPQQQAPPANLAPAASFTLSPPSPNTGEQVSFDGSSSADPEGPIASHTWDFGDGTPAATGARASHVYTREGSYEVKLTVTDAQGASSTAAATLRVGSGLPPGTPTGRTIADLPRPETGQTINVGRVSGEVLVEFPEEEGARASQSTGGTNGFVPLDGSAQIPVGSTINTNKGVLRLQSGSNSSGSRTQTATFFLGMFELRQARSSRPVTEMVLKGGSFRSSCRSDSSASASASGPTADDARRRRRSGRRVRRGKRVRRLWGSGRGRFRTRGRYSSATVRGTKWVVEETCNGTFTRVARRPRNSRVAVRDLVSRKTITLRSGDSYFAPRGRVRDARISLRPSRLSPGGRTTVTGRGWGARRLVTLRVRADGDGSLTRVVRVRASRRGGFKKRVRLARDAGTGRYTVQACSSRCGTESTAPLSLRAP